MKKTLSIILAMMICIGLLTGCGNDAPETTSTETQPENAAENAKVISPLPETIDVNNLESCTVAATVEEGSVKADDNGKKQMTINVYTYELYDMVDIAELKAGDSIARCGENVKIESVERLDSGLVRINGGEEKGGFDLATDDSTVYYEIGMSNMKNYRALGKATLTVAENFVFSDAADAESGVKEYKIDDFLAADSDIEYNFVPNSTSVVIENGVIIEMNRVYMS